ncbi:hypothetical protein ACFL15_00215 [Patescibacteria group bacterium]
MCKIYEIFVELWGHTVEFDEEVEKIFKDSGGENISTKYEGEYEHPYASVRAEFNDIKKVQEAVGQLLIKGLPVEAYEMLPEDPEE